MGRLATMLGDIQAAKTPLERRVDQLGRQIARWVLALAAALGLLGIVAEGLGRAPEMIIFAVALAVAAVPEGLPAVLTVALALGVERMARHRAVVRRLSAVEALGSVTVIATDKTGTLTESRMDVRSLDAPDLPRALAAIVLANDADLTTGAGDPLDLGLLRHAAAHGVDVARLRAGAPHRLGAAVRQRLEVRPRHGARGRAAGELPQGRARSAPRPLHACRPRTANPGWKRPTRTRARGFACWRSPGPRARPKSTCRCSASSCSGIRRGPKCPTPSRTAQAAGIRVIMITGDHPATALAVAHLIGIPGVRVLTGEDLDDYQGAALIEALGEVNVFARVRPEQKLQLVEALQAQGEIVAMTGDGVNDAPALKRSDVGVAMGQRGSDVSREVADLVLLDDNFATIVGAVEEGRGIYENIQKFLRFLFSTNLSEVLLVAAGAVLAFALDLRDDAGALMLPLTAAQILWINLMTDGLPALALAFDRTPGRHAAAAAPGRLSTAGPAVGPIRRRRGQHEGAARARACSASCRGSGTSSMSRERSRSTSWPIGQLLLTYPSRHTWTRPLPNAYLHAAVIAGVAIQLAAGAVPVVAAMLGGASLPPLLWGLVFASALVSWTVAEAWSRLVWGFERRRTSGR